jgi:hypothetical protein
MTNPRALRYRQLALVEQDPEKAKLLRLIAEEAEKGILCVPAHRTLQASEPAPYSALAPSGG